MPIWYVILNLWVPLPTRFAFLVAASSSRLYLNHPLMLFVFYIIF